jgi:hypothetical protein
MFFKNRNFIKSVSCLVAIVFILSGNLYSDNLGIDTLAPPLISAENAVADGAEDFREGVREDMKFMSVAYSLAQAFFENGRNMQSIYGILLNKFKWDEAFLRERYIDLADLSDSDLSRDNVIKMRFISPDGNSSGILGICPREQGEAYRRRDKRWEIIGDYAFFIEKSVPEAEVSNTDIKGKDAPETDPIIGEHIRQDRLVEIYLDDETGEIRVNRVKWVRGYEPGMVSPEIYRDEAIDPSQIFSPDERMNLKQWMSAHRVRGSPVRFRVVLGDIAIGWNDNIDRANVSHAGIRDRSIYIGSLLLKHIMGTGNESLRTEILDDDEYRHLKGEGHGSEDDVKRRIERVKNEVVGRDDLSMAVSAMVERRPYDIKGMLVKKIRANDVPGLLDLFSILNNVYLSFPQFPVEASYPLKHAVALLDRQEKEQLGNILMSDEAEGYSDLIVLNDILLMIIPAVKETKEERSSGRTSGWIKKVRELIRKSWVKKHAPRLEGRNIWEISPEIWNESGGLSRVTQYHGAGKMDILEGSDVRYRQIEPHYANYVLADEKTMPLDYTKRPITHPLKDLTVPEGGNFEINMNNGMKVKVEVTRGVNDLGAEVFLLRDKGTYDLSGKQIHNEGYYTHSIFNYHRFPGDDREHLPTWREFSMFYSKAALEWVLIVEKMEREALGDLWKAPILHTNDSQTALVGVYKKIRLDEQVKKRDKDENYQVDPVLEHGAVFFTTHTYYNRETFPLKYGEGDQVMGYFGVPEEYREIFRFTAKDANGNETERVYDMASGGIRSADGQGCVSRAHREDIAYRDEWINAPEDPKLVGYYRDIIGTEFDLRALSNGDNRRQTTKVLREYFYSDEMKKLYGEDQLDADHPAADQLFLAKKAAKEKLSLIDPETGKVREFYISEDMPADGKPLRGDQLVISYSGRLVPEKAGRGFSDYAGKYKGEDGRGAFSNANIEYLVKRGVQVVIYGNVQSANSSSHKLSDGLKELMDHLKTVKPEDGYEKGKLLFVPSFRQEQQRALLAATDVQVQDSYPRTEAAGFTEADVSACGGIQVGTRRDDNDGIGEGLFQQQGIPMDLSVLGKGNVHTPATLNSEGYLNAFKDLMDLYDGNIDQNKLKYYQATSVRLSQILEARLTSSAYLREFSRIIERKERISRKKETARLLERRRRKMGSKDLKDQIFTPDLTDKPGEYTIYRTVKYAIAGETARAYEIFLTSGGFQGMGKQKHVPAEIFNGLIAYCASDKANMPASIKFLRGVLSMAAELFEDRELARDVQVMAGQALTIIQWINAGTVEGASEMRLTADPEMMVRSDKGSSFIDARTLPKKVSEDLFARDGLPGSFNSENMPGFFWRGIEMINKLGENMIGFLVRDNFREKHVDNSLVMYIMDHGFLSVPEGVMEDTKNGRMSTLHETFFLHDRIPGTMHTTSTGPGHYQALDLDIKHATEGKGLQVNVRYDGSGNIVDFVVTELDSSDPMKNKALSLPGYVDYVINLGGLRFNDIRITLSLNNEKDRALLGKLSPFVPEEFDDDEAVKKFGKNLKPEIQPYVGFIDVSGEFKILRNPKAPDDLKPRFMSVKTQSFSGRDSLMEFYADAGLDSPGINDLVAGITESAVFSEKEDSFNGGVKEFNDVVAEVVNNPSPLGPAVSMGKTDFIGEYVNDNDAFITTTFFGNNVSDRLVRISVESIAGVGKENIVPFLEVLNEMQGCYIELFSISSISEVSSREYLSILGFPKKDLPEGFARSRANTVTMLPVDKTDTFRNGGRNSREGEVMRPGWRDLGNMWDSPENTIISPVGINFDKAGIIRGLFMGLRLARIAADPSLDENSDFVKFTLSQYRDLCVTLGQDGDLFQEERFDLTAKDLIVIARGGRKDLVEALNKMIRLLPIVPLNFEEVRNLYERAREALIRA